MLASTQQAVTDSCPQCGAELNHSPWVFVDTDERLDLVEQIGKGELNRYTCETCGTEFIDDYPLLLYFAGADSPFLYSPALNDNEEQKRRGAAVAENFARKHFGQEWQARWTRDGLLTMPREQLVETIRNGAGNLREAVILYATTAWASLLLRVPEAEERRVIETHPELLRPAAVEILQSWKTGESEEGMRLLDQYCDLLIQCREMGIEQAFLSMEVAGEAQRLRAELSGLLNGRELNEQKSARAIDLCRRALELLPETENALELALIRGALGQLLDTDSDEALSCLEAALMSREVLKKSPDNHSPFLLAYAKFVKLPKYEAVRQRAIEKLKEVRLLAEQEGSTDSADLASRELLRARLKHGRMMATSGQLEKALQEFNVAVAEHPKSPEAHANRAKVLGMMKQNGSAEKAFSRAIELAPEDPMLWYNRGTFELKIQRWSRAKVDLEKAVHLKPDFAEARVNLGNCLLSMGREEEAFAEFQKAAETDPKLPQAAWSMALVLLKREQQAEAMPWLRKAAALGVTQAVEMLKAFGRGAVG